MAPFSLSLEAAVATKHATASRRAEGSGRGSAKLLEVETLLPSMGASSPWTQGIPLSSMTVRSPARPRWARTHRSSHSLSFSPFRIPWPMRNLESWRPIPQSSSTPVASRADRISSWPIRIRTPRESLLAERPATLQRVFVEATPKERGIPTSRRTRLLTPSAQPSASAGPTGTSRKASSME